MKNSLSHRQITIITGLRRVGKTTLMFQLIDALLKENVNPFHILYFSFDESQYALDEILEFYQQEVLQGDIRNHEKIFLFLDEIQKLPQWSEKIKMIYDLYPNVKITVSGSASILLFRHSRESLAGRFFEYTIQPLNFLEFLSFKNVEIDFQRETIFKTTIISHLNHFYKTGGFIEAISLNPLLLKKYFRETLLERVIFKDIPENFSVKRPALLLQLVQLVANQPGMYLDYKNVANDLNVDQRTVAEYITYLEYSLLIQKLYNFSPNWLTSEKKTKRAYLSNTGFTLAMAEKTEFPVIVEQFWINFLAGKYFYRSPQKDEVDLVLKNHQHPLPVEIKLRNKINLKGAKVLFKFMNRFQISTGLMITLDTEGQFNQNGKTVHLIPYWKYHSILTFLKANTDINTEDPFHFCTHGSV